MKKIFFLITMLVSIATSATVTVTPMSVDYTTQKVTFKVEWNGTPIPYNNRVWVWVDLCPVVGTSPSTFVKADISNPSTIAGSIEIVSGNNRGFYVTTNPSTVTAILSNVTGKFNWCAYGSDYPPNVLANTNGSYTLAGTPPFKLIESNGITAQIVTEKIIATSAITITPATITDATGYPGLWCPYTGSDLLMDATHRCQQRQSGAYNWEAWIKDTRDSELYRIVQMPDNHWWLAQNVKYANAGSAVGASGCTPDLCGRYYTVTVFRNGGALNTKIQGLCPPGWFAPRWDDYNSLANAIGTNLCEAALHYPPLVNCTGEKDRYGVAITHAYYRCSGSANYCGPATSDYTGTNNNANSVWLTEGKCTCGGNYTMGTTGYGITWRCYR
jgi:uncharacterized protein (TIGR02145 family)